MQELLYDVYFTCWKDYCNCYMAVSGKMSSKIRFAPCLSRQASFSSHFHWIAKSNFLFLHWHLYAESFLKGLLYSIAKRVFSLTSVWFSASCLPWVYVSTYANACANTHWQRGFSLIFETRHWRWWGYRSISLRKKTLLSPVDFPNGRPVHIRLINSIQFCMTSV